MILQEGSPAAASKVLLSFQSMVQGQLAKIKSDLQAGKAFPQLPIVKDLQAFQVQDLPTPSHCALCQLHCTPLVTLAFGSPW